MSKEITPTPLFIFQKFNHIIPDHETIDLAPVKILCRNACLHASGSFIMQKKLK